MEDPPQAHSSRTALGLSGPRVPGINCSPRRPHKPASIGRPGFQWSPQIRILPATTTRSRGPGRVEDGRRAPRHHSLLTSRGDPRARQ